MILVTLFSLRLWLGACAWASVPNRRVFEQEKNEGTWKEWSKVRAVLDTGGSKITIPFTPSADFFPLVVWELPESCFGGADCHSAVQEVAELALGQQFHNRSCAGVRVQALGTHLAVLGHEPLHREPMRSPPWWPVGGLTGALLLGSTGRAGFDTSNYSLW